MVHLAEEEPKETGSKSTQQGTDVALVPKDSQQKELILLRPMTLLQVAANAYSKLLLQAAEPCYDGLPQGAMVCLGVPEPLAASYARELRATNLQLRHASWETFLIAPTLGLRQGCFLSPMGFKWVLEGVPAPLKVSWEA